MIKNFLSKLRLHIRSIWCSLDCFLVVKVKNKAKSFHKSFKDSFWNTKDSSDSSTGAHSD